MLSLLALTMVFAMAAVAFAEGETYLWDNFDDRDPNAKPELAPNGVHLWWDNWANLRAKNEDGALKLDMRPKAYDPEDYDSEDDYYAHAADWMANWGEAVDMWGLDGVSYCKYLTIRIKGAEGGEENKLIMDWHPEDSKFYAARFSDLVLADGTHPVITTEWQDLVIDLEASGFPGHDQRHAHPRVRQVRHLPGRNHLLRGGCAHRRYQLRNHSGWL